jgi:carbamoyl-phosphate synthase large subunit
MWALQRAGVPVPGVAAAGEFADCASALRWGGGAVIVKPRVSRGGRGVQLIESAEQLDWTTTDAAQLVQTFAAGTEYNPQLYRSPLSGDTRLVVLEKTALRQGRVGNAAQTVRLAAGAEPDVEEAALAAARALDLVGPIDMDIRRDASGTPLVLEVNGRFGANSASAPELLDAVLSEWTGLRT